MPNLMTIGRHSRSRSGCGGSIPVPRVSHESIYRDVYMPSRKAFDGSKFHRLSSDRFETASAGQAVLRPRPDPQQRVHPRASRRSRYSGGSRASRAADAGIDVRRCAVPVADITTQLEWNESSLALTPCRETERSVSTAVVRPSGWDAV